MGIFLIYLCGAVVSGFLISFVCERFDKGLDFQYTSAKVLIIAFTLCSWIGVTTAIMIYFVERASE